MALTARKIIKELREKWDSGTTKDILIFCQEEGLIEQSEQLSHHLTRPERTDDCDLDEDSLEKADWLVDRFFRFPCDERQSRGVSTID